MSYSGDVTFEKLDEANDSKRSSSVAGFQPFSKVAQFAKEVLIDKTLKTATTTAKGVIGTVMREKDFTSEEYLAAKSIDVSLNKFNPQHVKSRIITGFSFKIVLKFESN